MFKGFYTQAVTSLQMSSHPSHCDVDSVRDYVPPFFNQSHHSCQHALTSHHLNGHLSPKVMTSSPAGPLLNYRHFAAHAPVTYADSAGVMDDSCAYQAMQYSLANPTPAHAHHHHPHVTNSQWYFMYHAQMSQQVPVPDTHLNNAQLTSQSFPVEAEVEDGDATACEENRPKYSWLKSTKSRASEWKRGWAGE